MQTLQRARVVCYGLFSLPLCVVLPQAFPSAAALRRIDDEVHATVTADRDAGAAEVAARFEQVMTWATVGDDGRQERTAPEPGAVLDLVESEIGRARPPDDVYEVWDAKKAEIRKLRSLYAGWQPIFKFGGGPLDLANAPRARARDKK